MSNASFSNLYLLAFTSNPQNVNSIHALMELRGQAEFRVEAGTIAEATEFLAANGSPRVLLVEIPSAEEAPALLDRLADVVNPKTRVIVTGPADSLTFYKWLMDLGIHEYLLTPLTAAQLGRALDKAEPGAVTIEKPQTVRKLVGLIGARGGVGTTILASNLATLFAENYGLMTGLVDLDPHFGSVALSLDLEPGKGMRDALEKPERVDGLFLDRVMIRPSTNLGILSAEEPLQEVALPHANAGQALFSTLAEKFAVVVADLPRQMNPLTRHVLAHADLLVIVAEPHLIDLRDALRVRDYVMEQLKRPAPLLLINREGFAGGKHELSLGDITKYYGAEPVGRIPVMPEAFAASAQGKLLVHNPKLAASLAPLHTIASRVCELTPAATASPEKKAGLSRLLKPKAKD